MKSVETPEQPIDKAGCNGLRIIFSDESNITFRRHARCGICTNLVAHSARSFHPLVSRSCVMHHGDVHYGKVVVPRLVGQEDKRKKHGARPDRSKRLLGTVGHGWLEGRREGATLVQQRCQWSAAKSGVTSVVRLHDARHPKKWTTFSLISVFPWQW